MADYTIDRGVGVRDRMDLLAKVRDPATRALFDLVGIPSRARCVDLGCGAGHVAIELARRVGPDGYVLSVDLDAELLEIARERAAREGLQNVEFRVAPVEEFSDEGFDVAFSRLLFMHLSDPQQVARLMVNALQPSGVVVLEDADFSGCFSYPSCAAHARWVGWYQEAVRRNGGDANFGPRLPSVLRSVGLTPLGVRVTQDAFLDGPEKQLQPMSMARQRAAVVAAGVVTADEYDAAHAEMRTFASDPTTLLAGPRIVQSWGRRS